MGIDVYMRWKGQTEEEAKAQITGFSIVHGHAGYLREAYHGGPYVTKVLAPEAYGEQECITEDWDCEDWDSGCPGCIGISIPAAMLRKRLPEAIETAIERSRVVYEEDPAPPEVLKSFTDFVELAEQKEAETGEPVRIHFSG